MLRTLRGSINISILVSIIIAVSVMIIFAVRTDAINNQINFQGKITNPNGTNVATTNYNFTFSIYTVASGGVAVWTETKSILVTDGIFQTALGDTTALPGSVDFNSSSLYLGVQVASDPEMTPRVRLTAAPYAFNSDLLDGLDSNNFVRLAQGLQVDSSTTNASISVNKTGGTAAIMQLQRAGSDVLNIANSGAYNYTLSSTNNPSYTITNNGTSNIVTNLASTGNVVYQDNGATFLTLSNTGAFDLTLDATDDPSFTVTNNGSGNVTFNLNDTGDFIIQDSGVATLTVTETGATTFKNSADSTAAFLIQKAGSTVDLLTVDSTNNRVYIGDVVADTTGTLLVLDSKSDAGDPTGVNGGSYYNSNSNYFRCFQNGLWQNCLPPGNGEANILAGPVTWTNQPAADTEFTGTPRTIVDLTNARQFRFVMRAAVAGFAGSDCRVQYSATDAGAYANLDGATGPELAITATTQASAWTNIVAGARADIFLRVMCKQGNGVVDPQFRTLKIDYR